MKKQFINFLTVMAATAAVLVSCDRLADPSTPEVSLNPANCHIVSTPGTYAFQAVKGKSSEQVLGIASVEILWESFGTSEVPAKGDILAEARYTASDGLVHFKTPSKLKDGNALIAAKDASGNILWSWHIWVCEGWDPGKTAHTYYNDAGIMMDRNLGATSVTPGDVKSLGLLYQWGRKDPFLGASSITERVLAASTLNWPEPVMSTGQTGTIAYAIAHPTTFIASEEDNYDWYYTGDFYTDNTRWQEDISLYDPCPAGWTLPDGPTPTESGFWYTVYGKRLMSLDFDVEKRGRNFTKIFGDADPIWFPLAGCRSDNNGRIWSVGDNCGLWTSTPDLDLEDPIGRVMALGLDLRTIYGTELSVFTAMDYCRAVGYSVRCVAEK